MGSIEEEVLKLVKRYGTSNPFEIAKAKGIVIRYVDIGSVLGFHMKHSRTSIIHINEKQTYERQLYTLMHELGHVVLHPELNSAFLKVNTFHSMDRYETEANEFAISLLLLQEENITIKEATEQYGIPKQLLYKKIYT